MSPWGIGGPVLEEEIERVMKEHDKKYPFPSCELCKHKQIIVLKYRKYKGKIIVKEATETCEFKLDMGCGGFRRAVECLGCEAGENQYIMEKKE